MSKFWVGAMSVVMIIMVVVGCMVTASADDYDYTMMTVIVGIEWDADTLYIVCLDSTGDTWVFEDCDEWHVGDMVRLYMIAGETLEDDIIDGWEYMGTLDLHDMAMWILLATN